MDPSYDSSNAKLRLSELIKEHSSNEHSGLQLARFQKDPSGMSNFQPMYGGQPGLWRMIQGDSVDGMEEVVVLIQGIICKKDMPPFEEHISPASKHVRHLRQSISIIGLGLDDFKNQVDMIPEITALFTRALNEDKIQLNAIIRDLEEFSTLNTSNHYFMPRKDIQTAKELAFPTDVDPHSNLSRLLGLTHAHIEENMVSYYKHVGQGNPKYIEENMVSYYKRVGQGNPKYVNVKPASICIGDIVELQVSFVMVPLHDNNFKATMVLRSILVLDHTQKTVVMRFSQQTSRMLGKQPESLKRRVSYFEEELSATRARLADMQVDENDANSEYSAGMGVQ